MDGALRMAGEDKKRELGMGVGKRDGVKGEEETGVGQDRAEEVEKDKISLELKDRKLYSS